MLQLLLKLSFRFLYAIGCAPIIALGTFVAFSAKGIPFAVVVFAAAVVMALPGLALVDKASHRVGLWLKGTK